MSSRDARLERLVWQRIHWPQPLADTQAIGLLRSWAAQAHAPLVILEARADRDGVQYLLGSQRRHAAAVRRDVEQLVPDALVVESEAERQPSGSAGRVAFSPAAQPLQTYDADTSTRALLAALTAVRGVERMVIQVILGPRIASRLTSKDQPRIDQGIASLLAGGVQTEHRPAVRRGVEAKRAEPGFAAVVRFGVHAAEEARAQTLARGVLNAFRSLSAPGMRFTFRPEHPGRLNTPSTTWPLLSPTGQHLTVTEVGRLSAWPVSTTAQAYPGQPQPTHARSARPSPPQQGTVSWPSRPHRAPSTPHSASPQPTALGMSGRWDPPVWASRPS